MTKRHMTGRKKNLVKEKPAFNRDLLQEAERTEASGKLTQARAEVRRCQEALDRAETELARAKIEYERVWSGTRYSERRLEDLKPGELL
jgi:hypothetical protein